MPSVLGFGSGVLDIIVRFDDHPEIYDEITSYTFTHLDESKESTKLLFDRTLSDETLPKYLGGGMLNSLRCVKEVVKEAADLKAFFVIGKDEEGSTLISKMKSESLEFVGKIDESKPTSVINVAIKDKERQFFVRVGSGRNINSTDIDDLLVKYKDVDVLFMDFYLIGYLCEVFEQICAAFQGKLRVLTLGSPQLLETFTMAFKKVFPLVDLLFCNEEEFKEMKKIFELNGSNDAETAVSFHEKYSGRSQFTFVKTCGEKGVEIFKFANGDMEFKAYPAIKVESDKVIDTNGAGDSYAGGFVAGLILGKSYEESNEIGAYLASQIVQKEGFQKPEFNYLN